VQIDRKREFEERVEFEELEERTDGVEELRTLPRCEPIFLFNIECITCLYNILFVSSNKTLTNLEFFAYHKILTKYFLSLLSDLMKRRRE